MHKRSGMRVRDDHGDHGPFLSYLTLLLSSTTTTISMAHVAFSPHPQLDFPRQRPVADSPSSIGFGFTPTWNPSNMNHSHSTFTNPAVRQQLASHMSPNVPVSRTNNKRRLEEDENDERGARDEAMDRSPTPERRRAALPKRTRLGPSASDKHGNGSKESKSEEQDVDVGVLLG